MQTFDTSSVQSGLAQDGDAPSIFSKLSMQKVPRNALFLTCVLLFSSVALLYAG